MPKLGRRTALLAAAATMTTGLFAAAGAAPAMADTVTVNYDCVGYPSDIAVTIDAPATAGVGDTATFEVSSVVTTGAPQDLPAGEVVTDMAIVVGGAQSGTITASGLTNEATPAGQPVNMVGGEAQITFTSAGSVTFTPSTTTQVDNGAQCTVVGEAPVGATTVVS